MAKRKETIQKIEIKKDLWDYVYTGLMVFFTGILAISGIWIIPKAIEPLGDNGWQRIDYEELRGWIDSTFTNPNGVVFECESLPNGSSKTLEDTYATCKDGKIVHVIIKKDESGECFSRWEGSCE